jgi:U3 small nucleolar ribonucleoprotein protein IMP4
LITTSRDPSQRLVQFQKEMKIITPNSIRINRGGYVLKDLVKISQANNFTDIMILHETRGEPDGLIVSHLPYGPTAYFGISNVVLRHDLKDKAAPISEAYPHLIFNGFES